MKHAPMIARSLIALLFVVAGVQKLMNFTATSGFISSLGLPMAGLVTIVVIFIEIAIAASFAYGYKTCMSGWTLIAFTALATIFVHRNFAVGDNMIMALKNVAIIGGIWCGIQACTCGVCPASKGKHGHSA